MVNNRMILRVRWNGHLAHYNFPAGSMPTLLLFILLLKNAKIYLKIPTLPISPSPHIPWE
ncbi:MAG: hypothetical protein F6K65_33050 [Moorea sp. SIO3C2]|nr:hypothetical protein [Moorena sp. SIO3C2]